MRWGISCVFLLIAACSTVPPIEQATGGVAISDIVRRVKCEMAIAFHEQIRKPKLIWMADWTAKIDLTLRANTQGTISPNMTHITKLTGGTFSFGFGASLKQEAERTELLSFSLALAELILWYEANRPACEPTSRHDLTGGLGLAEWVETSIEPVGKELQAGDHPPPDAKGGSNKKPRERSRYYAASPDIATSLEVAKKAAHKAEIAKRQANKAVKQARNVVRDVNNDIEPYKSVLAPSYKMAVDKALMQAAEAIDWGKKALAFAAAAITASRDVQMEGNRDTAWNLAQQARVDAENAEIQSIEAKKSTVAAKDNAPRKARPPFDSISHSVQFTVSYTGTVSPNWSLVQWRGPSGNLASAEVSRVHTLNMALGPRSDSDGRDRALGILALRQLRIVSPTGTIVP